MSTTKPSNNEDKVKKAIIESTKAIRLKHKKLKLSEDRFNHDFRKTFKPIVEPLNKLLTNKKKVVKQEENVSNDNGEEGKDEEEADFGEASGCTDPLKSSETERKNTGEQQKRRKEGDPHVGLYALKYVSLHLDEKNAKQLDKIYGIRKQGQSFFLGNSFLTIKRDVINIDNEKYVGTPGLFELLFMKRPDSTIVTQADLFQYKILLEQTSAHKQHYDPKRQANSNRGYKYVHIIKPLFLTEKRTMGSGMRIDKPRYEYWDDPNELVARLRLLLSSQSAGNNSHQNEILSIVEELREANIIE